MSVSALAGCAGLSPVIAGMGYFGLGLFRDHRQRDARQPEHVDVEGVGLLLARGRVALGYAKLCHVTAGADSNFHLKLTGAELAVGADADAWALELNAAHERQLHVAGSAGGGESSP